MRAGAVLFLGASAALIAPACADNESSLFIRACMSVPPATCGVKADPTAPVLSSGILDAAIASEYRCAALVGNQLVRRGDPDRLKTETSRIQIYGADVAVLDTSGAVLGRSGGGSAEFFTPASGFADPGAGTSPGYGLADVVLIDAALAADLASQITATKVVQQVVVSVVLRGRTLGGNEIKSAEFQFPVQVCKNCLCDTRTCADPMAEQFKNCRPGLDSLIDCHDVGCCPAGCL